MDGYRHAVEFVAAPGEVRRDEHSPPSPSFLGGAELCVVDEALFLIRGGRRVLVVPEPLHRRVVAEAAFAVFAAAEQRDGRIGIAAAVAKLKDAGLHAGERGMGTTWGAIPTSTVAAVLGGAAGSTDVAVAQVLSVLDELVPADAAAWWEAHRPAALRVIHDKWQSPVAAAVAGHGGRYTEHERPRDYPCRGPRAPRGRGG
jgi:hypothetical protein